MCDYDTAEGFQSGGIIWMMYGLDGQMNVLALPYLCAEMVMEYKAELCWRSAN